MCADTTTPHYGWVQPAVGGDASTWGTTWNNNLALIDAQVFAGAPIGSVAMFAGATAPANYLLCQGQSLSTTAYAALFAVIGYAFGGSGANFSLPNLSSVFPLGANAGNPLGQRGGSYSYTISLANLPSHNHGVNDPGHAHSVYDPSHNHGVNDPGHNHGQSPHGHGISDPGHVHGGGSMVTSSYNFWASNANWAYASTEYTGVNGWGPMGGAGTGIGIQAQYANINAAGTGVYLNASGTGIGIYGSGTGVTIQYAGSGAAMSIVPSYVALNFIIRFA